MRTIKITQIKSAIDRPERQKLTLRALGLNKMNASRDVVATPQILGMVRAVDHLLKVEAVNGGSEDTYEVSFRERDVAMQEPAMFQPEVMTDNEVHAVMAEETPQNINLQNNGFEQESSVAKAVDNPINELNSGLTSATEVPDAEEVVFKQESIHPSAGNSTEDEANAIS